MLCCAVLCLCSARGIQPRPQAVRRGRCSAACQGRARGYPGKGAGWAGHLVRPPSEQCQELLWLWFLSQSCQGTHCVRSWGAGQKTLPLNSVENTKELAAAAALLGLTHGAAAYPLLVNVSQEDAALPVVLLPQRVVPVLRLHQTGKRKQRSGQEPGASHAPAAQRAYSLLLHSRRVGAQIQRLADPVADVGALPGAARKAEHAWGTGTSRNSPLSRAAIP